MKMTILHCKACNAYTLRPTCSCLGQTVTTAPPKYSPDDRHVRLTRQAKEEDRKKRGLL